MALTWEQAKSAILIVAKGFVQRTGGRYELWELVNEVWLSGRVQVLSDICFAQHVSRCAILDYMRTQNGRTYANGKASPRKRAKEHCFEGIERFGDGGLTAIDSEDEVNHMLRGMSVFEKRIILRRLTGTKWREIGDNAFYQNWIRHHRKKILKRVG